MMVYFKCVDSLSRAYNPPCAAGRVNPAAHTMLVIYHE